MNSSSKGQAAAQLARDTATAKDDFYLTLSAQMCWDAVISCAHQAGALSTKPSVTAKSYSGFVALSHPVVADSGAMRAVPQGALLGFFEGNTLIHAMISTGAGFAAGNKNACVNVGAPVGWENLDLAAGLNWQGGGTIGVGPRKVTLRYRATYS